MISQHDTLQENQNTCYVFNNNKNNYNYANNLSIFMITFFCKSIKWFVWLFLPSLSFYLMTNLHFAACGDFGLLYFLLFLPNPEADNHQACCCSSIEYPKSSQISHIQRFLVFIPAAVMYNLFAWTPGKGDGMCWFWASGSRCFMLLPFYAFEAFVWAMLQQSRPK